MWRLCVMTCGRVATDESVLTSRHWLGHRWCTAFMTTLGYVCGQHRTGGRRVLTTPCSRYKAVPVAHMCTRQLGRPKAPRGGGLQTQDGSDLHSDIFASRVSHT